ncbi:MAG: hypothetical protein A2W99_08915 [Bacteroidetes bacterium GWF2_33_16]|nr:MAG: hypothetical protein A2X00_00240 [Bacteroidetes bacterium GWE2_32_14]OFY05617.1 MAG: hypothetical protein A2W99_08915 [Bacteroidetes bacterium GWF2_33_16]
MKRIGIIFFLLFIFFTPRLYGQVDSLSERLLYNWTINPFDLNPDYSDLDTILNEFQHFNPLLRNTISNNYLGNLGTAAQSKIYFDRRKNESGFLFSEPYSVYFHLPYEQRYFNTKRQFTLLNYSSGGPREESEQAVGILHTQNVTKDFNVGIDYDLISSAGRYQNQKTQIHGATIFSSFKWKGYRVHGNYTINKVSNEENGGIDSLQYLGSKEYQREQTIPVKLKDASFKMQSSNFYLLQEFRFGSYDEIAKNEDNTNVIIPEVPTEPKAKNKPLVKNKVANKNSKSLTSRRPISAEREEIGKSEETSSDTIIAEIEEVNKVEQSILNPFQQTGFSVSHELIFNKDYRKYSDSNIDEDFYSNLDTLINSSKTMDAVFQNRFGNRLSAHYRYIDLFSVRFSYYNEQMDYEYNIIPDTLFKFDLDNQPKDTVISRYLLRDYSNNNLSFYFHSFLFKRILIEAYSEYYLNGYKRADSHLNLLLGLRLFEETWIDFKGEYRNQRPNYFYEHFMSNHFQWDNKNLIRQEEWDGDVIIRNDNYRFEFSAGYSQITGHIFLDTSAKVHQYGKQINIFSARLKKQFTLGPFHSTTRFVYQKSTNDSLLSLPENNLYQSLYYEKLFHFSSTGGELKMQAGLDYHYSSNYMADAYMPVTGLFYRQYDQNIDDYHCLDIFINFAIKRARLYLIYNYLNSALNDSYYFTAPSYPAPPAVFKFGVSWTFYD